MTACLHPVLDDKETTPVYILKSHLQLAHQLHLLSNGSVQYLNNSKFRKIMKEVSGSEQVSDIKTAL